MEHSVIKFQKDLGFPSENKEESEEYFTDTTAKGPEDSQASKDFLCCGISRNGGVA